MVKLGLHRGMKTCKICFTVKEPDEFDYLVNELGLSQKEYGTYLEFREYATFELEIDSDFNVVSGRIMPIK